MFQQEYDLRLLISYPHVIRHLLKHVHVQALLNVYIYLLELIVIDVIIRAVIHGIKLFLFSFPIAIDDNRAPSLSIESYAHIELFKLVYFLNYIYATTQKPL